MDNSVTHRGHSTPPGPLRNHGFDTSGVDFIRWHQDQFDTDLTWKMLHEHARVLLAWHLAMNSLLGDVLTSTAHSYQLQLGGEAVHRDRSGSYHQTLQSFEHGLTLWSLGLQSGGADAAYPPPTQSVNFAMQNLD